MVSSRLPAFAPMRPSSLPVAFLIGLILFILLLPAQPTSGAPPIYSAPHPARAAHQDSSIDLVASASTSLSLGLGPARGSPLSCGPTQGAAVSCNTASAMPRPAAGGILAWVNLTTAISGGPPSGRFIATMVYDAYDGYVLLFGGALTTTTTTSYSDTWSYQNGVWTDISSQSTSSPGARYGAAMAYDGKDHEVVLFGGHDVSGTTNSYYSDTWTFSNGSWANLSTGTSHPGTRWRANMAYDAADGYVVLFGGTNPSDTSLSDTWSFVGNKWMDLTGSVTGTPPGRLRFTMAYDVADKEIVVFGGCTVDGTGCATADTWTYSNKVWAMLTPTKSPSARVYTQMAYDPAVSALVLFGGTADSAGSVTYSDTWEFSGTSWTDISAKVKPPPAARGYQTMAYDPVGSYLVMDGGNNGNQYATAGYLTDTWAFGPKFILIANATPAITDLGQSTAISTHPIPTIANLTYSYVGLPAGCSSANNSTLKCKPIANGTFTVGVTANDSMGNVSSTNVSFRVNRGPTISLINLTIPKVTVTVATRINVTASGGTGSLTYAYSKLPPGCGSMNTPSLLCRPTSAGSFAIQATVTDQVGGKANATATLTVAAAPTVAGFVASPPKIDLGLTVKLWANVSGGTGPFAYAWSLLPGGCFAANLSPLLCHPSSVGSSTVSVKVTDKFGVSVTGTINVTVEPDPTLKSVGLSPLSVDAGVRVTVYTNVTPGTGTAPFQYSFSNAPGGCSLPNANVANCIPVGVGVFPISVTVTDAAGYALHASVTLTVVADPVVTSFTIAPTQVDLGQTISVTAAVTGGTIPYVYAYTGLPPGCSGSIAAGFSCNPTQPGHYLVTLSSRDLWGQIALANTTLNVSGALKLSSFALDPSSVAPGGTITVSVVISGGTLPYAIHYSGLPLGCPGSTATSFHCSPSQTGSFTVVVTVTDAANSRATSTSTLSVGSSNGAGGLFGLPVAEGYGLIGGIVLAVAIAGVVLMRRRSPPKAGRAPPPESDQELEPQADESYSGTYGSGDYGPPSG